MQPTGICFVTNEPICAAFLRCRVASAVGPEEKYLLHTCNTDVAADITEGSKNRADHRHMVGSSPLHCCLCRAVGKKKEAAPAAKRPQGALCFLLTKKTNKQTERYSEVMSVETEEKQTKAEAAIALFGNCCCWRSKAKCSEVKWKQTLLSVHLWLLNCTKIEKWRWQTPLLGHWAGENLIKVF